MKESFEKSPVIAADCILCEVYIYGKSINLFTSVVNDITAIL